MRTAQLVGRIRCIPVTVTIAKRAGEMKLRWSRRGRALSITDTMIAATALEHESLLMTQNRKHFPEEEILFYPRQ
jgi:predicted nucleic acid-binding protein